MLSNIVQGPQHWTPLIHIILCCLFVFSMT